MQKHLRRLFIAAFMLLPIIAVAHPGHSAFDPRVAPHSGHEWEIVGVLAAAGVSIAAGVFGFFKSRR